MAQINQVIDSNHSIGLISTSMYTFESILETANYLLDNTTIRPFIGIICGTGMGLLSETLTEKQCFPYKDIPNFPVSTVEGHIGQLVFGNVSSVPVVCMQGRVHYYEGYPLWKCCMPIRVMKLLGVTHLIITNAAGGINSDFNVGDIMLIKDHVNLMGFAGNCPLVGPNDERFGPRFPSMNNSYNRVLIDIAKAVSKSLNMESITREGVYTSVGGPNFETSAEIKLLKMLEVDAVGMSTVHEVITARHCDITVFGFSLITNLCVADYDSSNDDDALSHMNVLGVGQQQEAILTNFVSKLVEEINKLINI